MHKRSLQTAWGHGYTRKTYSKDILPDAELLIWFYMDDSVTETQAAPNDRGAPCRTALPLWPQKKVKKFKSALKVQTIYHLHVQ